MDGPLTNKIGKLFGFKRNFYFGTLSKIFISTPVTQKSSKTSRPRLIKDYTDKDFCKVM